MIRIVTAAALACLAGANLAIAQTSPWTFEGIPFAEVSGWCPTRAEEDDGAGGKTAVIHVQRCGQEFPQLSAGIGARGVQPQDIPGFTSSASAGAAGDEGKATVDGVFRKKSDTCVRQTFSVDNNPVRNLPAFQINATYACPGLSAATYQFHNVTAYAQQKNGDIWIVAFDSNSQTLAADEEDLIRNAVAAISAH